MSMAWNDRCRINAFAHEPELLVVLCLRSVLQPTLYHQQRSRVSLLRLDCHPAVMLDRPFRGVDEVISRVHTLSWCADQRRPVMTDRHSTLDYRSLSVAGDLSHLKRRESFIGHRTENLPAPRRFQTDRTSHERRYNCSDVVPFILIDGRTKS